MVYTISDISEYAKEDIEPLGTKSKYWFIYGGCGEYLYKVVESVGQTDNVVYRGGEDWSEKIACEIAKSLSIPCADYDLARNKSSYGVITKNFIENDSASLTTGNEVLKSYVGNSNYQDSGVERQDIFHVYLVLKRLVRNKPIGYNSRPGVKSAADFFCGYLMLDALVSNQDRHSENWGFLVTRKGTYHLAPTFDHAASLGRNESIGTKKERLETKDGGRKVSSYVKRARSYFYLKDKRMKTLSAFEYFAILRPRAGIYWIDKLLDLKEIDMKGILEMVPRTRMDDTSKEFALEMLVNNRDNIISLRGGISKCLDVSFRKRAMKNYE